MKALLLYFMCKKYFRLIDRYHDWQYTRDEYETYLLGCRIDRLKTRIRVLDPTFLKRKDCKCGCSTTV